MPSAFMPVLNAAKTAWVNQPWDPVQAGDSIAISATKLIANGDTLFTVTGDIEILDLQSECVTANDATASTLQYTATPTGGSPVNLSAASASLASAAIGAKVVGAPLATLATAAALAAAGIALLPAGGGITMPAGLIKAVVGVGSTTGTWKHTMRYRAIGLGASVS